MSRLASSKNSKPKSAKFRMYFYSHEANEAPTFTWIEAISSGWSQVHWPETSALARPSFGESTGWCWKTAVSYLPMAAAPKWQLAHAC